MIARPNRKKTFIFLKCWDLTLILCLYLSTRQSSWYLHYQSLKRRSSGSDTTIIVINRPGVALAVLQTVL